MSHRAPGLIQRVLGVLPLAITASVLILPAATTWADAAGPTDFQSSVVSIEPATPQIHPSIIGGDSFLRLRVDRGTEVDVLGYRSEPFIRFLADGTVEENRASASYLISKSRLGDDLPADFVDDAPPEWHTVADDGDYSWHDHRMHWMSNSDPPGKQPGDVVLQQTVHLVVDGAAVQLVVESVWVAPASTVPAGDAETNAATELMRIGENGRVGIGVDAPNNALDVVGTVQADGFRLDVTPTAETPASARDRICAFWAGLDASVITMSPAEHDAAVAYFRRAIAIDPATR